MSPSDNGGRVTTREFYEALLKQNEYMGIMERRIVTKLDIITSDNAASEERFRATENKIDTCHATLTKDIDKNAKEIGKVRNLNTLIALLGSTIAGIIGINK